MKIWWIVEIWWIVGMYPSRNLGDLRERKSHGLLVLCALCDSALVFIDLSNVAKYRGYCF